MFELSKEQKAVILLSRLTFSREDVDDIKDIFLNGNFNWIEFVKYTTYHKTLTLNFCNLTSLISENTFFVPRYVYTLYRSFYNSIFTINLQQEKELHQILHDARARDIILIPVKGIHLLHDLYKDYGVRFSGDMDILLRKHDVEKVSKVVHENDFVQKNYNPHTDEFIDSSRAERLKWKLHMSNLYPYRKRSSMDVYPFFKVDFRFALDDRLDCKCQRKSEPGAHEKVSHKRPRKSEPERSRIVDPVC